MKQAASGLYCALKRWQVTNVMLTNWQSQYESFHKSLSWLQCDTDQESHGKVDCLRYKLFMKDKQNIQGSKNFYIHVAQLDNQFKQSENKQHGRKPTCTCILWLGNCLSYSRKYWREIKFGKLNLANWRSWKQTAKFKSGNI